MSSVPGPLVVGARSDATPTSASREERAQREVSALYSERAGEFLSYAVALGRNEELARDALQEAFMRYFIALCQGEDIVSPRAWIYRVLHNYLLDRMKEPHGDHKRPLHELPAFAPDPERECFRREVLSLVRNSLTAREYDCIRLRTEGLRYEEIARKLQLSSGAVGALISRAVRKTRNALGLKPEGRE